MSRSKRKGVFKLPLELVEQGHPLVSRIMSQCIVIRAEALLMYPAVEYHAWSWRFPEIDDGFVVPEYRWIWDDETEELRVVEVER